MTKKRIIPILLLLVTLLFSCSLKTALTERYTMFMMGFPQVNYPIVVDSSTYINMMRKEFKKIDTFYYSLLYDQDRDTNTTYLYLGKYDMGSNNDGVLYSKVKKEIQDTTIFVYIMVSTFDSIAYKLPVAKCIKKQDTLYIENLVVHNDEFDIYSKKYIGTKLDKEYKLKLKLRQQKKSKIFRIDTTQANANF